MDALLLLHGVVSSEPRDPCKEQPANEHREHRKAQTLTGLLGFPRLGPDLSDDRPAVGLTPFRVPRFAP